MEEAQISQQAMQLGSNFYRTLPNSQTQEQPRPDQRETFTNIVSFALGTGMLSLPYFARQIGILPVLLYASLAAYLTYSSSIVYADCYFGQKISSLGDAFDRLQISSAVGGRLLGQANILGLMVSCCTACSQLLLKVWPADEALLTLLLVVASVAYNSVGGYRVRVLLNKLCVGSIVVVIAANFVAGSGQSPLVPSLLSQSRRFQELIFLNPDAGLSQHCRALCNMLMGFYYHFQVFGLLDKHSSKQQFKAQVKTAHLFLLGLYSTVAVVGYAFLEGYRQIQRNYLHGSTGQGYLVLQLLISLNLFLNVQSLLDEFEKAELECLSRVRSLLAPALAVLVLTLTPEFDSQLVTLTNAATLLCVPLLVSRAYFREDRCRQPLFCGGLAVVLCAMLSQNQ